MSKDNKELALVVGIPSLAAALILFLGFTAADYMVESIYEALPYLDCRNHD